jgi:glycosyltransferase involved in cell wall biosynthesis
MRLDEVKRPVLWIDTAASILGRLPDARIIIVGDGPFGSKVKERAEALGVVGRCLFVGRSTYVGYWLSKMDVLMLLSEHEGLPNALIEAQLAGVPVITTAAGGAPETLMAGVTGLVTSRNPSPGEVAELIAGIVGQPGRLKAMGIAAEHWANQAFTVPRMLSKTLELYAAVGENKASSWQGRWQMSVPKFGLIGQ